ncbi:beta-N-acetylhexosaminidase [Cohnella suwonensis]|uniref:Beta-N-acetylhexosaminidase n=1 Tax=Cohnella suwonensis TaxID=696072 RepID=A0ABW0LMS5_9BACL
MINPLRLSFAVFGICLTLLLGTAACSNASPDGFPQASVSSQPTASSNSSASPTETPPSPTPTATPETTPPSPTSSAGATVPGEEVEAIVRGMSLEMKVGQMILAGVEGTKLDTSANKMIAEQRVGGVILFKNNFSGLTGSARFVNELKKANEDSPVPLFVSVDQEGGRVSRLPADFVAMPDAAKVGRTGQPELAERMGALLSEELTMLGINVDFAPVLDVNSNPKNPVIGNRAFGNKADVVTRMGLAVMQGLREGGTIGVVKHFPGHGDSAVDSHLDLPVVNKTTKQLKAMEWVPFKAAIADNADAVMVAHILFPKIDPDAPASFSKVIIGQQLRGTLGYDGVVITDDLTMGAISDHYGISEAAVKSVEAGSDILLVAHGYDAAKSVYDKLLQAVRSGRISEARIDQSVARIVALKTKYRLTDDPVAIPKASDVPNAAIRSWLKEVNGASGK